MAEIAEEKPPKSRSAHDTARARGLRACSAPAWMKSCRVDY